MFSSSPFIIDGLSAHTKTGNCPTSSIIMGAAILTIFSSATFAVEMCMGMGFPMGSGIPRESHGNGNKTQNWEWEWEGMGNYLSGNGNYLRSMGIYSQRFYAAMSLLSYYPRRARSALGVDTVLTLDVCLYVCMFVCLYVCMLVL